MEELSGGCVWRRESIGAERETCYFLTGRSCWMKWSAVTPSASRSGKTIARVVPEADGCTAEIAEAIERLKALRGKTRKAPLAEILASRHGGHKY